MKTIEIICNPTAGKGSSLSALNKIKEWAKLQASKLKLNIHLTENIGHATSIAQDLSSTKTPTTILVIGGDGTVNEVLNGIQNFETTTLGILPYGSGNDFVRSLKMNKPDPIKLIEQYIYKPTVKKIDYLLLNDKYRAINEVGLGLCADVIAMRNKMKHFKPETQYKIATMVKSFFWRTLVYSMSVDKKPAEKIRTLWFTINNGCAVGSGLTTADNAKIDDGYISIMYIGSFNHIKTLPCLIKVKKGKVGEWKTTVKFNCKEIELHGKNMALEYDGNLMENLNSVNVKIIANKLNLLVASEEK